MPIVVVADDLSGAVELAGVAYHRGLNAEVLTRFDANLPDVDVVCLDLDTRSKPLSEAVARFRSLRENLPLSSVRWLYKKTDSLLRGHVAAETKELLSRHGDRAVICPANPSRGRVIADRRYLVNGVALDQTVFTRDPRFPRTSAKVDELLGDESQTISVPDVVSFDDLLRIANISETNIVVGGGAEFFDALLLVRERRLSDRPPLVPTGRKLYVCGSLAAWESGRGEEAKQNGVTVLTLDDVTRASSGHWNWTSDETLRTLERRLGHDQVLMIAVGQPARTRLAPGETWETLLAGLVYNLVPRTSFDWYFLEGGATARAMIEQLNQHELHCVGQVAPGIVALRTNCRENENAYNLVIKPGSYPWPDLQKLQSES